MVKNKVTQYIILFILLIALAYYFYDNPELLENIREVNPYIICILVVLNLLLFLSSSLILRTLLQSFDLHITIKECLGILVYKAVGNHLLSFGSGAAGNAFYLKKKYDFYYPSFISLISVISVINMLFACIMGAGAIIVIGYTLSPWLKIILWFFLLFGIFLCSLFFLTYELGTYQNKLVKLIAEVIKGWNLIKRNSVLMLKISLLLMLNFLLGTADIMLSYRAFLIEIPISYAILMAVFSFLVGVVRILPGNIGIYEGSIALTSKFLEVGFGLGLLAAGLSSVVSITVIFVLGGLFGIYLLKGGTKNESFVGIAENDSVRLNDV